MNNADRLFRNAVFGGFNKDDVIDYIENMKNEFFEYRSQVEQTIKELNEKVAALREEAVAAKKEAFEAVAASKAAIAAAEEKAAEAEVRSAEMAAKADPDAVEEINSAADKLRRVADELCDSLTGFLDRIAESSVAVTIEQPQSTQPVAVSAEAQTEDSQKEQPKDGLTLTREKEADILSFIDNILKNASQTEESSVKAEKKKKEEPSLLDSLLPDNLFS